MVLPPHELFSLRLALDESCSQISMAYLAFCALGVPAVLAAAHLLLLVLKVISKIDTLR